MLNCLDLLFCTGHTQTIKWTDKDLPTGGATSKTGLGVGAADLKSKETEMLSVSFGSRKLKTED